MNHTSFFDEQNTVLTASAGWGNWRYGIPGLLFSKGCTVFAFPEECVNAFVDEEKHKLELQHGMNGTAPGATCKSCFPTTIHNSETATVVTTANPEASGAPLEKTWMPPSRSRFEMSPCDPEPVEVRPLPPLSHFTP